jgi:hypothetical protein
MQGRLLLAGLFSIVSLPFAIAYDLMPPALIPLQIPLALTGIFGTTGPVSFLVLGPSRSETSETCGRLVSGFSLLRAGAAVDPLALGALLDHQPGPSGNLWMGPGGRSWQDKLVERVLWATENSFDRNVCEAQLPKWKSLASIGHRFGNHGPGSCSQWGDNDKNTGVILCRHLHLHLVDSASQPADLHR